MARSSRTHPVLPYLIPGSIALAAAIWMAWEIAAHALTFDGYFANGAFQLLNPIRRLMDGQVFGRDFQNFHGIGSVWIHLPIFFLAGADFWASELSRYTTSGLLHAAAAVALSRAFAKAFPDRTSQILFALLFFGAGPTLFTHTLLPATSILGVRSFFPLVIALGLATSHRAPVLAALLAAALLTGTEHGAAAIAGLILAAAATLVTKAYLSRRQILVGLPLGIALYLGILTIVTHGSTLTVLAYTLVDMPTDQYWYFGSEPNEFLARDWRNPSAFSGFVLFACLYASGWAGTLYFWRRHPPLFPVAVYLMGYATFGIVSQLGYLSAQNLHPSGRAAFAVGLAAAIASVGRRPLLPVALTVIYLAGVPIMLKVYALSSIRPSASYLSERWRNHLAAVDRHLAGGRLWSIYAGLTEYHVNQFGPSFDYIIHALGPDNRKKYLEEFERTRPDLVRLDNLWNWQYGGWLLQNNWPFYRAVFQTYEPVYRDTWGSLWRPQGSPTPRPAEPSDLPLDVRGCAVIPASSERAIYSVEVRYLISNPWSRIPIVNKTPRHFLTISDPIDEQLERVSLPEGSAYGHRFTFPVFSRGDKPVTICPQVISLYSGVSLHLDSARATRERFSDSVTNYVFTTSRPWETHSP